VKSSIAVPSMSGTGWLPLRVRHCFPRLQMFGAS